MTEEVWWTCDQCDAPCCLRLAVEDMESANKPTECPFKKGETAKWVELTQGE